MFDKGKARLQNIDKSKMVPGPLSPECVSQVEVHFTGTFRTYNFSYRKATHLNTINPNPDNVIKFGAIHIGKKLMTRSDPDDPG